MQVLDYRHSDPTSSPPHNSSWLLDNQPAASPVPRPSASPPHNSIPLVSSNSLTGISSHQPPPSATPLRTSSSSTLHPSSQPSQAPSEVYPSQHPSAPRDSPLTPHSRLNTLSPHDNLNLNTTSANNINTHSTLSKFGNLLNVSNVAIEHDREHTQAPLSRSASNQHEFPSHSYPTLTPSMSTPLENRQNPLTYHEQNHFRHTEITSHDRSDPYQPMHRPQFPSQTYAPSNAAHRQDHFNTQHTTNYNQGYPRQASHGYDNICSPPYPGTAPMPVYRERTYGIPKFNASIGAHGEGLCQTDSTSYPSFKPMPGDTAAASKAMPSTSSSPGSANDVQRPKGLDLRNFAVSGTLFQETIEAFQSNGMNQERSDFLRDYIELMKAYEEKCDVIYDATERTCMELMLQSRVPLLEDTMTAPVDDETPEDARQKLVVKKKFVGAMEALQGDRLPTKRRGNLPKECTEYLKKWFDEHYDHPYPNDEEKLEMSKRTKIGMSQISHWFINYRKRVWKPSLPANHPALTGDQSKKPRKRQKLDDDAAN